MDTSKYFDKIWCLSCLNKQRLETSKKAFEQHGLDVEYYYNPMNPVIHACPKLAFESDYYMQKALHVGYDTIYDRVASCFMGHYNIIKTSYELGYDKVLILEDDVQFLDGLNLNEIFEQIPDDWDVLNFYARGNDPLPEDYTAGEQFWVKEKDTNTLYSTTMYAVNRRFMNWYLNNIKLCVADRFYKFINTDKMNVYINNYNILTCAQDQSLIETSKSNVIPTIYDHDPYVKPLYANIADGVLCPIVAKCACSSLSLMAAKRSGSWEQISSVNDEQFEYKHFGQIDYSIWPTLRSSILLDDSAIDRSKNNIVAVYRDPVERLISAKHVLDRNSTLEQYIENVIETFRCCDIKDIDMHILPQSLQYDAEYVDLFVDIKKLPKYFKSIGLQNVAVNKTPADEKSRYDLSVIDKYMPIIKQIYKCDYDLIASIPEAKQFH